VIASSTPTSNGRWPNALRAAVSTAIPVSVGWAAGNMGSGLIATLGSFTKGFGSDRPYLNRGVQLAVIAVALAGAVALGSWAAQVAWAGVVVVSAVAVAAVWLCNALSVGPPGAYVFVLVCAAGLGVSASHLEPWQIGALVLAGGAVAWLTQMAGVLRGPRRPERAAVAAAGTAVAGYLEAVGSAGEEAARHRAATALHRSWNVLISFQPVDFAAGGALHDLRAANHALHVLFAETMATAGAGGTPPAADADTARRIADLQLAPETVSVRDPDRIPLGRPGVAFLLMRALRPGSHIRHVMVRVGIAAPLAGAAATLLGIGHAYWAIAAAVLVLHQGADRSGTLRRGTERLVGTWVGLALAAGILLLHPQGLWLALVLVLLQFPIELLVVRHYGLASVFITAAALTISTGTRQVDIGEVLLARGSDTLVGCAIGVAVFLLTSRFQESTRLVEAIADTVDAVAATSAHIAAADTASLAARASRRDLQLAAIAMRDAADAAGAGSVPQRAAALRLSPVVTATEHLAYRTIAACWAMDNKTLGPPFGADDAVAYRAQLHRLASALRAGAVPPEIRDAPNFVATDVTALSEAARQDAS
jgi:uncharacterized membrane protein YccC